MKHNLPTLRSAALKSIALAALLTLQQAPATAASSEELKSVKLYGDVTIAQDSLGSWGPWEQFEPPAAGPGVLTSQRVGSELFRTLPKVANATTAPVPVIDPTLVGFGVFSTQTTTTPGEGEGTTTSDGPHPLSLVGNVLAPAPEGSVFPGAIQLNTTPLSTGSYTQPSSDRLTLQNGNYESSVAGQEMVSLTLVPSGLDGTDEAQVSIYIKNIVQYITSPEDRSQRVTTDVGVIGYKTSTSDIAALRVQGAQGTYNGFAINDGEKAPVVLNVDFGKATWNGAWNGGTNSGGNVGFTAQGGINGALFSSTSVAAADANNIRGSVQGAFFGPQAAAAGGVADVTKDGTRYVAPFLTVKQAPVVQKVDGPK